MSPLVAQIFGGMHLRDAHGHEVIIGTRKTRALLAFLLLEPGRWHARERLAGLLWGDRSETQARNSLNQALHEIRKLESMGKSSLIEREADRLRLRVGSVHSDVDHFEKLLSSDPMAAARLFAGGLLEGLDLAEREFTTWLDRRRAQFQEALSLALRRIATAAGGEQNIDARICAARQLVALDPLDESARRQLMELLAQSGDRVEAIRQYRICANLLREELGITPDNETQRILAQIKRSNHASHQQPFVPDVRLDLASALPIVDRPVVAVLPFANLSDDHDLAYFADGLADDLIFSLSSFRWFRVLARGATFRLRDVDPSPSDIRQMFGATHLVTGRVRRTGSRLRVNVSLVDCSTAEQMWGGRYDQPLENLFDMLDEVTRSIVAGLEPALEDSEMRRTLGRHPATLAAYELLHRGYWHLYKGTAQHDEEARRCFEMALAKDSNYAGAMAGLCHVKYREAHADPAGNFVQHMEDCRDTGVRALELDPRDPRALRYFGGASCFLGDHDAALAAVSQSIELCPSYASAYSGLAFVLGLIGLSGRAGREADLLKLLDDLADDYGDDWWFGGMHAFAMLETGDIARALPTIERSLARNPRNAHGAHIRGHVYYESGDPRAGLSYLADWWRSYGKQGQMHCHISWHLALWELELGNSQHAWEIYHAHLHPGASWGPPLNALSDSASFLFRAEMAGERRDPQLWKDISDYALKWFPEPRLSFADVHGALAHAMAGNCDALRKITDAARGPAADIVAPVARAFDAFSRRAWTEAVTELSPLITTHERVGGSRAQRDLIEYTLVVCLLRCGRTAEARHYLEGRRQNAVWPIVETTATVG